MSLNFHTLFVVIKGKYLTYTNLIETLSSAFSDVIEMDEFKMACSNV